MPAFDGHLLTEVIRIQTARLLLGKLHGKRANECSYRASYVLFIGSISAITPSIPGDHNHWQQVITVTDAAKRLRAL